MYDVSKVPTIEINSKVYTQKEPVLIEKPIDEFHEKLYIPEIKNYYLISTCEHTGYPPLWQRIPQGLQVTRVIQICPVLL